MLGLFALRDIKKGELINFYTGDLISYKESQRRENTNNFHYLFAFPENEDLDEESCLQMAIKSKYFGSGLKPYEIENLLPLTLDSEFKGNELRFINHACEPNCEF